MDFKKLEVTTHTIMAYTNAEFDVDILKEKLKANLTPDLKDFTDKKHGELYIEDKKLKSIRNEIPVRIFIIDKIITIKIFKTGKFHMTGCKTREHAHKAAFQLLKKLREIDAIKNNDDGLEVVFEIIMANIGFELDFIVDREKLDTIVQEYGRKDLYSIYKPESQTSVNIKMVYQDPEDKKYDKIIIGEKDYELTTTEVSPKSKPKETRNHTFLVFGGSKKAGVKHKSKVIQSGRYYDTHMEPAFKNFLEFIYNHKQDIEMKNSNKKFDPNLLVGAF